MIVDPMLATGGSAVARIDRAKQAGAKDIRLVCLVGVQEGIDAVEKLIQMSISIWHLKMKD